LAIGNTDKLLQGAFQAHQAGNLGEAERLYRELLAFEPGDIDACNLLGILCLESSRPGDALPLFESSAAACPNDGRVQYNLGLACKDLSNNESATQHFLRATELMPDDADAHVALANLQRLDANLVNAAESYRTSLALAPDHSGARHGLSTVLNQMGVEENKEGDVEIAIELMQESVELDAGNAEALMNLGIIYEQVGRSDDALAAVRAAIEAKPDFANAHYQLAHLLDHEVSEHDIRAMEAQFGNLDTSARDRGRLAYGIGKSLERRGEYAEEFGWLREAHNIMVQEDPFDTPTHTEFVDNLIEQYPAPLTVPAAETIPGAEQLIFVVGMPRSGTTLTEQVLASHPLVFGAGESSMLSESAVRTHGDTANVSAMLALASHLVTAMHKRSNGPSRVVDTTPTNFFHIGLLAGLLPNAKIIHCVRHPLDTCLSIYQHPLSKAHSYAHDLDDLAAYYLNYRRLMKHWHAILPGCIYDMSYENTVADIEGSIRALLDHCDLPFDEACLEFHKTNRVIRTPSASQVRKPIYSTSVGRWKRYAEHLEPLKEAIEKGLDTDLGPCL
jgi:tetratricopeptide (TPR) repeat protein